jgi:hypothetical protein
MINRKELVSRHNPVLCGVDTESPLTVGNGDFAFTADITGLQTLYAEYNDAPLCTMSSWGWHTEPAHGGKFYTLDDVEMTHYDIGGRKFQYAADPQPGNEEVYHWLRHNPHRLNLARITLMWQGEELHSYYMTDVRQELELYTGVLHSRFTLFGHLKVKVTTVCAKTADIVGFRIESDSSEELSVGVCFPYGSHEKNASDWNSHDKHSTEIVSNEPLIFKRTLDNDVYYVARNAKSTGTQEYTYSFSAGENPSVWSFEEVLRDSESGWRNFWESGGAADFSRCADERAHELERRVVLSQYLCAVHSAGKIPPQETGLLCNSWYGKFHLEMHILHSGWFPLWGRPELLERSLAWYESALPNAVKNAQRNGFKGARWVKMTGPEGVDCPSWIATLLIWQQPHIIYMLELIMRAKPESERVSFMRRYWNLIYPTAEFMCAFAQFNFTTGKHDLPPPLIPAQEEHKPEVSLNPAFELCYWRFGLRIAVDWARTLGEEYADWQRVCESMADLPVHGGLYLAHQNCSDTFENFNRDHPSMLFGFGFIDSEIDMEIMSKTVDKVIDCWDFKTAWGWDFALVAMTLARLGRADEAVDILLMKTDKNCYVKSGNNYQFGREKNDLPLYLPGNGSLLFALALMLAGYGETQGVSGFPHDCDVQAEGIFPLPY